MPMRLKSLISVCLACTLWLLSALAAPAALAMTQIEIFDLSYSDCPPELAEGSVTPGAVSLPATCYMVTGKANNPSRKSVSYADIYGRIYDANDNPVMQNRTRLGEIENVPPGVSDFELRITVPSDQPTPLKLEQFKASGF
ncbi:MAG: hypothetical protein F6K19_07185 [Cyanothece sp. SIO1E1]|nr:hypothetical protein [Cyanothece sp. SIO1E1]